MSGYVLPVDKPPGPTSHDIVAMARRALGTRRIGHTGTLDPFASGLLLLCIGNATRISEYLTGLPKTYEAVLRLDGSTTTDDATGEFVSHTASWRTLSDKQIEEALQTQQGTIQQQPPIFSAKKITGQRAYELARAGEEVVLPPVTVTIYEIEQLRVSLPEVTFRVVCSSGTYVRALARDVGALLGTGGYLSELRRTSIGEHHVSTALQPVEMTDSSRVRAAALTPAQALRHLPALELSEEQEQAVRHGQAISTQHPDHAPLLLVRNGELIAVAEAGNGRLRPRKVFAS